MNDKLLIALIVFVVLLAHWLLFNWIRFKVDEAVILKFINKSSTKTPDFAAIANATQLKPSRVNHVCIKSKSINIP